MSGRPTSPARRRPHRSAEPGTAVPSAKAAKPPKAATPAASATPSKPAKPSEPAKQVRPAKQVKPAKPAQPAQPVGTAKPAVTTRPARTSGGQEVPHRAAAARSVVSATSVRRFAERARARRLMSWRRVALVTSAVAVLVLAGWVVLASPLLAVRTIEVSGTRLVPAAQVDALVDEARGRPLARVGVAELRARVETITVVRQARVERSWPSTLRIEVVERVPLAVLPADGRFDVVDDGGVVLATHDEAPQDLPLVQVDVASAGSRTVREAVHTLAALPLEIRQQVITVSAVTRDSVTLGLANGSQVFWGSADDPEQKAAVLQVLLQTPAAVYDVSAPDMPVTR